MSARRKAAGNSQRLAKTGACRGFAGKPAPFFNARRCSFLFPHFSQGGDCCALRATMILISFYSVLAGLRPAGSHCKNNLILTSGSIPHLRLGVSCKERIYHLLSPKGGAKSVRRAPTSGSDGAMRNLRCTARNDDYLLISYFSRSPACRIALRKERKDSYAPLHSVRNDKSCHPQEEVQTNSDTGIAPCIAPQTAEKKAVSDRFSAHLPENRKIIRNFAGQSINCRARI